VIFSILQVIASLLLLWALAKHPYDYYTLLRFVICPVHAYSAYLAFQINRKAWGWSLAISAVLFNPIFKIHLQRETWQYLNVLAALLTCFSILTVSRNYKSNKTDRIPIESGQKDGSDALS